MKIAYAKQSLTKRPASAPLSRVNSIIMKKLNGIAAGPG